MSGDETEYTDLVAFRVLGSLVEAELLQAVLVNAGIYAVVPLEHNVLDSMEVIWNAGMPVLIRPEDRDKAEEALRQAREAGQELAEGELPPESGENADDPGGSR